MSFLVKLFAIPSVLFALFVCIAESQRNKVAESNTTAVQQPEPQPKQEPQLSERQIKWNKENTALSNDKMIKDRLVKWIMGAGGYVGARTLKPGMAGYHTLGLPRGIGGGGCTSNDITWDNSENFKGELKYERIEDYRGMPAWKVQWSDEKKGYAYCEIYYDTNKKGLECPKKTIYFSPYKKF